MFSSKQIKKFLEFASFIVSLGIVISPTAILANNQQPVRQTNQQTNRNHNTTQIINGGLPTNRRDGGSRGSCGFSERLGFVALVPESGVNLSASASPKLYFHLPETTREQTLELVLRDAADRLVYEQFLTVSGKSGIMSVEIPLPTAQKSQRAENNYHWYLSSICDPQNRSQDIVLEGWIGHRQISEAKQQKLANLSAQEKFNFYKDQGFWHDSLELATQDRTQWSQLLTEIDLNEFSDVPLIAAE